MTISVLIVGGGASGVLLAIRLLRGNFDIGVTLVERYGGLGRGLAYATEDQRHVLNVVPGRMSAFADDPEHFRRWLIDRGEIGPDDRFVFVPRRLFGDYLDATLRSLANRTGRLQVRRAEVAGIRSGEGWGEVELVGGATLRAQSVILATGHDTPYVPASFGQGAEDLPALILGTGLSMVDAWLSLAGSGRRVVAMSRRGLLPTSHGEAAPRTADIDDLPFGMDLGQFVRWFRHFARRIEAQTGDWRPAVDALRPHTQRIWASWSTDSRRRFLRHIKPWWDTRRHRLPPTVHRQLERSLEEGTLRIIAGTPVGARVGTEAQLVRFRRRGSDAIESMPVSAVFDCRGLIRDWRDRPGSLISRLVTEGHARIDDLGLGIEVTADDELVAADGRVQPNLFALGPLTRGRWFEIEAVPDIRMQCDRLATHLEALARCQGSARRLSLAI